MRRHQINLPALPSGLKFDVPRVRGTFEVKAVRDSTVIEIFDAVGYGAVTATQVAAALRQARGRPVTVQINSPGGDYFEGATITNLLAAHDGDVRVQVLGIAASAGSMIAMAGDRIEIARNAQIMVHRAQGIAGGDADVMRQIAEILDGVDRALVAAYATRTGQTEGSVMALMRAERFLEADAAIDLGFADALLDSDGLPPPDRVDAAAPADIRAFEAELRRIGFSKKLAVAVAAHGWPAVTNGGFDAAPVAAALERNLQQLKNWRL